MRRWNRQLLIVIAVLMGVPNVALAQYESSTSYAMNESQIGAQGTLNSGSTNYELSLPTGNNGGATLGQSTSGNSSSTSYQTNAGYTTTEEPGLMLNVTVASVPLGVLSSGAATTGTAHFNVRDYTSSGYNVFMFGTAPTSGVHALAALTSDTAWTSNTEEFGVNLVTDPSVVGSANPTCQAVGFCYSQYAAGNGCTVITYGTSSCPYSWADHFRFPFPATSSEVIASSPSSSGETDYTMSFMAASSTLTPAGSYQGSVTLVATGSY